MSQVSLTTKHGVEAKNYENLGDAAKLKPLEVELKRLEDMSESIVQDFAFMRRREEEMRDTNESTNSRVLYFSIFSMCCLLGLATWQVSQASCLRKSHRELTLDNGANVWLRLKEQSESTQCNQKYDCVKQSEPKILRLVLNLFLFQVLYLRKYFKSKKLIE